MTDVADAVPGASARVIWGWVVIAGAWGIFLGATFTQHAYLLDHHTWLADPTVPFWLDILIFFGSWLLMLAAMMGPCLSGHLGTVARARRQIRRLRGDCTLSMPGQWRFTVIILQPASIATASFMVLVAGSG
jgi:hypothetical protein